MTSKEAWRDGTSALERPSMAAGQSAICDTRVLGLSLLTVVAHPLQNWGSNLHLIQNTNRLLESC